MFTSLGHMFERILVPTHISPVWFTSSLDKNPFPGSKKRGTIRSMCEPSTGWLALNSTPSINIHITSSPPLSSVAAIPPNRLIAEPPMDRTPKYIPIWNDVNISGVFFGPIFWLDSETTWTSQVSFLVQFFGWIFKTYLYMGGVCAIHNIGARWDLEAWISSLWPLKIS